jgi:glutamine synthetase
VLGLVEEENGRVRRVLAHRHLRAAQVVRDRAAGGARRARGRHGFDGRSITGFDRIEESDMIAMQDASAFQILRWSTGETHKVGRVFRDTSSRPASRTTGDPHLVTHKRLEHARRMSFDDYYPVPEREFFLFAS